MSLSLSYTWRPVLSTQFAAYAFLFGQAVIQTEKPIPAAVFGLCATGMSAISMMLFGGVIWHVGDVLLTFIDAGLFKLVSVLWNWLCRFVIEPIWNAVFFPVLLMILGWISLIFERCLGVAVFLWSISFGLLFEKLWPILVAIYTNPLTALPSSGGMLWVLFKIYQGVLSLPLMLQPKWLLSQLSDMCHMALQWAYTNLLRKGAVTLHSVLIQYADLFAASVGLNYNWLPTFPSVLGGEVFSDVQFGFRIYALVLFASILWRFALDRNTDKFYGLFGDLKIPESAKISSSMQDLKRLKSIGADMKSKND